MNQKILFVEKKKNFDGESRHLRQELQNVLGIKKLQDVRLINKYVLTGCEDISLYEKFKDAIFAEKNVDFTYGGDLCLDGYQAFAVELIPGQFDQRAAAAEQCMALLSGGEKFSVHCARIIALKGDIGAGELARIKKFYINPVDSRECPVLGAPTREMPKKPAPVKTITGFIDMDEEQLRHFYAGLKPAMKFEDLEYFQKYFRDAGRNPTEAELAVLDTYWSDHCRHTTFATVIDAIEVEKSPLTEDLAQSLNYYRNLHETLCKGKDISLMDMATIGAKKLKADKILTDLDESDEINACTIKAQIKTEQGEEDSLILFKNETHNHPTEIEPFGGAATCLGGAIRDPLSGRAYVYGAMRVTGSADPRQRIEDTLPGRLPQRVITQQAAKGYSSYGNQIGVATGHVAEIYHPNYAAKRMEVGAVIAAAPRENVRRQKPQKGDVVLLLGGKTGRDGIGGATGSSKSHDLTSLDTCGAQVQKGNPVEERKIQRFFSCKEAAQMIKKCNDFGAGGVAVAVGELSDGLCIDLDAVPKKYAGLNGTELAISESQERMAAVVAREDEMAFKELAKRENLACTKVAEVTDDETLTMLWQGEPIVRLKRAFLNTNGVKSHAKAVIEAPKREAFPAALGKGKAQKERWLALLKDLNCCCQKGLVENFDATIGANTVLMPFGGKYQLTPAQGLALKVPAKKGQSHTASLMSYGFNPKICKWSPYHGAICSVVESACKIAAMGGDYRKIHLSLQEYFEKLGTDPKRWGKPIAALLGALKAQLELGIGAIGGKDSMSGSFNDLDVPPTLISFAVALADVDDVISPELKAPDHKLLLLKAPQRADGLIDFAALRQNLQLLHELIAAKKVKSAMALGLGGIAEAVAKMAFGNKIGVLLDENRAEELLFKEQYGSFLIEADEDLPGLIPIGTTNDTGMIRHGQLAISLDELIKAWQEPLSGIFPLNDAGEAPNCDLSIKSKEPALKRAAKIARPRVFIPAFPGTNCEMDCQRAFIKAGGRAEVTVFQNIEKSQWAESIEALAQGIKKSNILMLPGGFSAGDEPDGSGKFIANVLKNPAVAEAIDELLTRRDGLILGICNGFQALIKSGLLPYGKICDLKEASPTLTFNSIGHHMSAIIRTKVTSRLSPWLFKAELGQINCVPISHGEGRFYAPEKILKELAASGQIATQYALKGAPATKMPDNPNGSQLAIEGITSPDGRIFGKMGHCERTGYGLYKNVPGDYDLHLFEAGVDYFS